MCVMSNLQVNYTYVSNGIYMLLFLQVQLMHIQ
jgi:hypothetical protein